MGVCLLPLNKSWTFDWLSSLRVIVVEATVNSLFRPHNSRTTVMSFRWQQVECHLNAPLQLRQTDGLWGWCCQNPGKVRERETGVCVNPSWSAVCLKANIPVALACFPYRVHSLPLHVSSLLCAETITHWSRSLQLHLPRCDPLWIFISLSRLAAPAFLPASLFLSLWMQTSLTVSYWFLFSLLLPCSGGCWIRPDLGHRLLPSGPIGRIKVRAV